MSETAKPVPYDYYCSTHGAVTATYGECCTICGAPVVAHPIEEIDRINAEIERRVAERIAAVRAEEREACAAAVDNIYAGDDADASKALRFAAAAIRARGQR